MESAVSNSQHFIFFLNSREYFIISQDKEDKVWLNWLLPCIYFITDYSIFRSTKKLTLSSWLENKSIQHISYLTSPQKSDSMFTQLQNPLVFFLLLQKIKRKLIKITLHKYAFYLWQLNLVIYLIINIIKVFSPEVK
jgi:hypothetical protein